MFLSIQIPLASYMTPYGYNATRDVETRMLYVSQSYFHGTGIWKVNG